MLPNVVGLHKIRAIEGDQELVVFVADVRVCCLCDCAARVRETIGVGLAELVALRSKFGCYPASHVGVLECLRRSIREVLYEILHNILHRLHGRHIFGFLDVDP